jgi:hypothetical protein
VKRILLFLATQVEGNPLLPTLPTTASLLHSWDKAAFGWSLQLLVHREEGRTYVFLRGNQGLIKHPELAPDGGVIRSDYKDKAASTDSKDKPSGYGTSGYGYGSDGQQSGGSSDPWHSKSDPWKSYFKNWSTDSQSSWDGQSRGWQQDGYGK